VCNGTHLQACRTSIAPPHSVSTFRMADPLTARLKNLIVETLRLEGVAPGDIPDNEPLIGGGLSLDSIDALELVVRLEKEFGVKISSSEESKQALATVESLSAFIRARADPARLSA
jgi:acyl carrier protein